MVHVNAIEFVWVLICTVGVFLTISSLNDAREDRKAVRLLKGPASLELAASTIVVGERFRLFLQLVLLGVAIPGLFTDRQTTLNPVVAGLMSLPIALLVWSWRDARARKRMAVLVTKEALEVKTTALDRIEQKVALGTEAAERAYDAANHTKERFDAVYTRIEAGEEKAAEETLRRDKTIETTAEEVHDLHEGTAPEGAS